MRIKQQCEANCESNCTSSGCSTIGRWSWCRDPGGLCWATVLEGARDVSKLVICCVTSHEPTREVVRNVAI